MKITEGEISINSCIQLQSHLQEKGKKYIHISTSKRSSIFCLPTSEGNPKIDFHSYLRFYFEPFHIPILAILWTQNIAIFFSKLKYLPTFNK